MGDGLESHAGEHVGPDSDCVASLVGVELERGEGRIYERERTILEKS